MAENRCHIGTVLSGHLPQKRRRGDFLLIECENLSFSYDGKRDAISDISLTLEKGEYLSLLGANGSGKSTLLKILDLILPYSRGRLSILGMDARDKNARKMIRRNIGFVFQNFNLIDERTVSSNVELPLIYIGMKKDERKKQVTDLLKRVNMGHRAKHFPQQLSGGQQQRVAIARAIIARPKLILADEPTGNLDSKNGLEVMRLLTELNREGTTVIMVTHSQHDASFARRTINLFDGHIVTDIKEFL